MADIRQASVSAATGRIRCRPAGDTRFSGRYIRKHIAPGALCRSPRITVSTPNARAVEFKRGIATLVATANIVVEHPTDEMMMCCSAWARSPHITVSTPNARAVEFKRADLRSDIVLSPLFASVTAARVRTWPQNIDSSTRRLQARATMHTMDCNSGALCVVELCVCLLESL